MVDRNMQIRGGQIKDGTISEAKLDISNAPVDGYFLRYNSSESKFEWVAGNDAVTEIPSGTVNGANQSFTITNTPQAGTEHLYLNGLYQEEGSGKDYQLSGTDITFVQAPDTGDLIVMAYLKEVAGASESHTQGTDQFLDEGGANESTAANVKDAVDKKHSHANSAELALVSDGDHDVRADNPHGVDNTDVGLGNVTNDAQIPTSEKGAVNGVAELDAGGKVPSAQLPDATHSYSETFVDGDLTTDKITITHSLSVDYTNVVVYDDNNKIIIPSEISRVSANAVELDFTGMTPLTGTYKVRVNK